MLDLLGLRMLLREGPSAAVSVVRGIARGTTPRPLRIRARGTCKREPRPRASGRKESIRTLPKPRRRCAVSRTLMLIASPKIDEDPSARRWIRSRIALELLRMDEIDRVIATAPLGFLRFSMGDRGPTFVYLHPEGAILIDGRDTEERWSGDVVDVLRAYRAHDLTARTIAFARAGESHALDATGLDAEVACFPEDR